MNTTTCTRHLLLGAMLMLAGNAVGQATIVGNGGGPGNYLGWDSGTLLALEVRHNGNDPIQWYTDSLRRMQLYPNVSPVINGYPALPRNGSLVLSNLDAGFAPARVPFSRLHLIDVGGNTNATQTVI